MIFQVDFQTHSRTVNQAPVTFFLEERSANGRRERGIPYGLWLSNSLWKGSPSVAISVTADQRAISMTIDK